MKKYLLVILLAFYSSLFAQQLKLSDINKISNQQLDKLREELKAKDSLIGSEVEDPITQSSEEFIFESTNTLPVNQDFGYSYFKRDINFFDNIPTPSDFKLGPGDELILSVWGEVNFRQSFTINKEGFIYFENIGFINIANQTLGDAKKILNMELSKIYSTLKDSSSQLMLELGKIKSINIYFSGNIETPGINLVHPFSDIFSAIVQANGISNNGSLRQIELFRNNKLIATVDFYTFFMSGINTFSDIRLIDGDVIHIPSAKKRVSIKGEVNRPNRYELIENEKITDLIRYASGLTSKASSSIILDKIIPFNERLSDDNARTSQAISLKNLNIHSLNDGDVVNVLPITEVESKVELIGRVKSPGLYPAVNTTLKHVLDLAGGFDDPIYRQTINEDEIIILRSDDEQFYSTEILLSYKEADKFELFPNDKIFVYEDINYRNNYTYRVEGEVNKPGTFVLKDGITVNEAITKAKGLTQLADFENIIVFKEFVELNENDEEIKTSSVVANADLDFIIGSNTVIKVLRTENVIKVEGNVYNPGLIAFSKGITMSQAIIQAGGYKPYSMKKIKYVKKANGEIDKANLFRGRTKRLNPGDTVFVPVEENPSDFDITAFISDLSTTLANIAAILIVIENNSN